MARKQNVRVYKKEAKKSSGGFSSLMKKIAGSMKWLMIFISGVVFAAALILGVVWISGVSTSNIIPVNKLSVTGQSYTTGNELYEALKKIEDRGFFSMDMNEAEKVIVALPWVKAVYLRKVWPDTLNIDLLEHEPLAYWGANGIVSKEGLVFYPNTLPKSHWVELSGPENRAQELTNLLQHFSGELKAQNLLVSSMELNERGAIELLLGDGTRVKLGKDHTAVRLERFIEQYRQLKQYKEAQLSYVDLRYQNGFVAAWQQQKTITGTGEKQ